MFPTRPHEPASDDSLGAIINLCLSLNLTQSFNSFNTNHMTFQVLQQFVRRRKERIEAVFSSTKTRRPGARHSEATARHPEHPRNL